MGADATPAGGLLLVLSVLVPFTGVLVGLAAGGRGARHVALACVAAGLAIAAAIAQSWLSAPGDLVYLLGGWPPPLGVALRADGPAVAMIGVVAVVVAGVALYAWSDFSTPPGTKEARAPFSFWLLLLAVWGSLDLVFVAGDLFTLYVALELLTFAGVPLVCLDGRGETVRAALRYLLFALLGSMLYLLGAVLVYGAYGTLDLPLVAAAARADPATLLAAALMTAGLLAKTALFPLHLWLPPAHAGAPPAASAILSALVIKGSWFLGLRLWFDALPAVVTDAAAQVVSGLGAIAIVVAGAVALRQERLKLVVAYSTLAQIGYLFLVFAIALGVEGPARDDALAGGILQAGAHATAKAAMFMAAGLLYKACGHDRLRDLGGALRASPLAVVAFAMGGIALMGALPSGAYLAKKLLQDAAADGGQWWWVAVLQAGGALTAGYVVLVVLRTLGTAPVDAPPRVPAPRSQEMAALLLAFASFALALAAIIGVVPVEILAGALSAKSLGSALLLLVAGAVLALAFAREAVPLPGALAPLARAARRVALPIGRGLEQLDFALRGWPAASLSLIAIALALAAALLG
jgi:formate hydrogenlyase subunit 3/multisubunit Na+/H+ antiporter MnhD subunit